MRDYPAIQDAAVIRVPDDRWGEAGCAFVIVTPGAVITEEDVIAHCRSRLARFKIPRDVAFCSEFPRTPLGKVRKFILAQRPVEPKPKLLED